MDGIKYAVFTNRSIRSLGNNQYASNVESGSTRTEIKHWVELFFGVKVIAMNSHRCSGFFDYQFFISKKGPLSFGYASYL